MRGNEEKLIMEVWKNDEILKIIDSTKEKFNYICFVSEHSSRIIEVFFPVWIFFMCLYIFSILASMPFTVKGLMFIIICFASLMLLVAYINKTPPESWIDCLTPKEVSTINRYLESINSKIYISYTPVDLWSYRNNYQINLTQNKSIELSNREYKQ